MISRRLPRLATNFAILSGAELVSKVLVAVAFIYLARVLGATEYGHLEVALAVYFVFTLLVDWGMSPLGAREIARDRVGPEPMAAHVIRIRLALSLLAVVLLVGFALIAPLEPALRRLILSYGVVLLLLPGLLQWVFQARHQMGVVAAATLLRWGLFALGVFLLVRDREQLWRVPLIEGAGVAGAVLFFLIFFRRRFGTLRLTFDPALARRIARQALPLGASELVWAVRIYFATVFLGLAVGGEQVGWYGVANRTVISLHTFVFLYYFNLLPAIAETARTGGGSLERLLGRSLRVTAWGAVAIGLIGSAFAVPGVVLLYGSEFAEAGRALAVLVWVLPLALLSGNYRFTLIAYDRQQAEFAISAVGAVVNVTLNLLLVPLAGFMGAAWALVITEGVVWLLALFWVDRRVARLAHLAPFARPIAGGLILTALLLATRTLPWIVSGAVAIAGFAVAATLLQPELLRHVRALAPARR